MPAAVVIGLFAYFFGKYIRRFDWVLYGVSFMLACTSFFIELGPLIEGELALGIWLVVIFTGVIPFQHEVGKRWRAVRKELAILGFILISPHAFYYLFVDIEFEWIGVIAYALMVPLTVISFTFIRRKMNPKLWKRIQQLSYLIYGLTFIHLIVVGEGEYVIPLVAYVITKLFYEFKQYQKRQARLKAKINVSPKSN